MNRGFDFLKRKYYEVLMLNLFVQMSDKLGTVLDVMVVGFLIGSAQLPALNVISPFFCFLQSFISYMVRAEAYWPSRQNRILTVKKQTTISPFRSWDA